MAGAANFVLGAIIGKAITPILDTIGHHLGYLFCYKSNIKNLGKGVAQLEKSRNDAVIFLEGKKRNNEETTHSSSGWLEEVKEAIKVAKEVEDGTTRLKGCLNLKGRYVLSRKSTKLAAEIQTLQNKAPEVITTNSVLPTGMLQGAATNEASKGYKTRMKTMDEVKKALEDDAISVIGICGLGGVGKTTMVHEVRAWAWESKLIDDFALATVSKDQNLIKIQGDLAEMLGLTKLKEMESVNARADELYKRLTNGNRVLVVLDDVWSNIKLKDVGVPSGNELTKCKVVITSRQKRVCTDIQKNITVKELDKEEARALFRKTAGEVVEKNNLEQIADDLADECGGLPIALLTLSTALSNKKDNRAWKYALEQLREGRLTGITGMKKEVYESIKLSYDFLASENQEEAQSLLLLCCQHQEDAAINVERLAQYCLSLELFEGVTGVVQARRKVYSLIEHLRSCFLLQAIDADYAFYGDYADKKWRDEEVKVHDVVKDVCLSIVSKVKEERDLVHMQIMEHETDNIYKIDTTNDNYPKLKLSVINNQLIRVLQHKGQLRVLECFRGRAWYTERKISALPRFQRLANLRMLYLEGELIDQDRMEELMRLTNLEILSFRDSSIDCLPSAIGQLSNLKLLDLRCDYSHGLMIPIPSGILGGLTKLEVLYLGNHHFAEKSFKLRDEDTEGERETRISELDSLTNLTTLQILLLDPVGLLGLKHFRFNKLGSFFFGSAGNGRNRSINYWSLGPLLMKTIEVEKTPIKWVLEEKLQPIVSSAVELCLDDIKDWTDPLIIKQFSSLRKLEIKRCNQLEYIIPDGDIVFKNIEILSIKEMSNVTELCHNGHLPEGSLYKLQKLELWGLSKMRHLWVGPSDSLCLVNLTKVTIINCGALKCIFPHSAIKCLTQLVELSVLECDMLMGIVYKGEEGKVAGRGEEITTEPNDLKIHFPKLRYVIIGYSSRLESFYNLDPTQPFFNSLVMLPIIEKLDLCQNNSIKAVFDFDGMEAGTMREDECLLYNELQEIRLLGLSELQHICRQVPKDVHIFQNLRILSVEHCQRLSYLIPSSIAHLLVNLEVLDVQRCAGMKEVFYNMNEEEECGELKKKIVFCSLHSVALRNLDNISSFCSSNQQVFEFPSLEKISIIECPIMETFCCQKPRVARSGMLEEINVSKRERTSTGGNGGGEINNVSSDLVHQFPKLKKIVIRKTPNFRGFLRNLNNDEGKQLPLSYQWDMLPSTMKLNLYESQSLQAVFDFEGFEAMTRRKDPHVLLGELQEIQIKYLPKLEHLCRQVPKDVQLFQNLRTLRVENCGSLTYLFPSSIAHMLVNLRDLIVNECDGMKEIVSAMNSEDSGKLEKKIVLRSLTNVEFVNLEELSLFCSSGQQVFEFPSLKKVRIIQCPKIETFCWHIPRVGHSGMLVENVSKKEGRIGGGRGIRDVAVQFPKLENVYLERTFSFQGFCNLDNEKSRLLSLNGSMIMLPSIKELYLYGNHSLKALFDFEWFEAMTMRGDPHVFLYELQEIEIKYLPKLEHLCRQVPKDVHIFQNLRTLRVENCGSLTYLLPSSIAHVLVNLQDLIVHECEGMKEIFSVMKPEKKIVLSSLTCVELVNLGDLSSFCRSGGQQVFEFPSLKKIRIIQCPKIETFCWQIPMVGDSGTSLLNLSKKEGKIVGGICDLVAQFPKLENVSLEGTPSFRGFHNLDNDKSRLLHLYSPMVIFPSMAKLKVHGLHQLKHIVGGDIPSFAASDSLNNLQILGIRDCDSLISLFDFEDTQIMKETPVLDFEGCQAKIKDAHAVLSKLEIIWLRQLPNLEHICRRVPKEIHLFQNLRSLRVYGCHSLSYLFTSTLAHMLLNLSFLMIFNCKSMTEVIKMGEYCDRNKIVFGSLSHVEILSMEKLSSFCASELQEFDFPSLNRVYIVKCPAMTTFCNGNLTAEKLQGVYIDDKIDDADDYEDYFDDDDNDNDVGGDYAYDSYDADKVFWEFNVNETVRYCNARFNQLPSDDDDDDNDDVEEKCVDDVGDKPISKIKLNDTARHLREDYADDIHPPAKGVATGNDQCVHEDISSGKEKSPMAPVFISSSQPVADNKTMEKLSSNRHEGNPLQKTVLMTTMASSQSKPENELYKLKDSTWDGFFFGIEVPQSSLDDTKNKSGCTSKLVPNTSVQADFSVAFASWRGHMVTNRDKDLLESVEKHFPGTYEGVNFRNETFWQLALDNFCRCLSKFLVTNVSDLSSNEVAKQRDMLLDLMETFKFKLNWALNRLDKVEKLRFRSPLPGELEEIERQRAPLLTKVEHLESDLALAREELCKLNVLRETKLKMLYNEFGSGSLELLEGSLGRDLLPSYQSVQGSFDCR